MVICSFIYKNKLKSYLVRLMDKQMTSAHVEIKIKKCFTLVFDCYTKV